MTLHSTKIYGQRQKEVGWRERWSAYTQHNTLKVTTLRPAEKKKDTVDPGTKNEQD